MSLGLLDDDNPWNDNQIPPNSTPDTGHGTAVAAAAAANSEEALDDRAYDAFNGAQNGYVAGAKRELDLSNGHALDAASRAADGWPPTSSPSATNGAASRRPSATASTSSTSPPASRLHRSTSNASSKSRRAERRPLLLLSNARRRGHRRLARAGRQGGPEPATSP